MNEFGQILVAAAILGSTYALVGSGFAILFKATGVLSLAQGDFMLIGAFIFAKFASATGAGFFSSLLVSFLVTGVLGSITYLLIFRRLVGVDPLVPSVASIALGTLLATVAALIWGVNPIQMPNVISLGNHRLYDHVGITDLGIATIAVMIVFTAGIGLALAKTKIGARMRAVADDPRLASYMGISVPRVSALAWSLAAGGAALAGTLYSLASLLDPSSLPSLGIAAFPAILLGGLDSILGSVVGGLLVGLFGAVLSTTVTGQYQDVASYGLMLLILLVRPQGLFGSTKLVRL
jgi:branched-chain amino acid transport system permease protein